MSQIKISLAVARRQCRLEDSATTKQLETRICSCQSASIFLGERTFLQCGVILLTTAGLLSINIIDRYHFHLQDSRTDVPRPCACSRSSSTWIPLRAASVGPADNDFPANLRLDHSAHQLHDEWFLPNRHTMSTFHPPTNPTNLISSNKKAPFLYPESSSQPVAPTNPLPSTSPM